MYKSVNTKVNFSELEKEILSKWHKDGIVDQYLTKNNASQKRFSFLDGPITANNPMGVHHGWGRTYKDLWQRFFNMRGFKQRFQNGFDCQGLWVEVEVERELKIKSKKDIENLVFNDKQASIAKFVDLCKKRVLKYAKIQTEQSKRLGYFMDWDNSYYTMSDENNYMIWYFLKVCHQNGWIYKGTDSVPWCPRCETAISQHEMLTEDYKEIEHKTVFIKYPVLSKDFSLVIWTTTPWTVPANVAIAVNSKLDYRIWESDKTGDRIVIVDGKEVEDPETKSFLSDLTKGYNVRGKKSVIKGRDLVGLKYKGPFDSLPNVSDARRQNPDTFHTIVDAPELVTASEGTGILHVATGAGTEDFRLGKEKNLPVLPVIDERANYLEGMGKFGGKNAKDDPEIILADLKKRDNGKYFLKTKKIKHRYPTCWRCKTELVWRVTDEWYIAMDKPAKSKAGKTLREKMIDVAKGINWIPDFGLSRELDWLSNMEDWLISKKNRYWGLALPIWECAKCLHFEVIGSKEELRKKAVSGWKEFSGKSPHKPQIDSVFIECKKCKEIVSRVEPVGNPWLDAGIVPFSTYNDPKTGKLSYTKDKNYWREWFPADFITESFPGQFKNWFYSLIAMSTVLEDANPFKTVLGFAMLLGEDGRPMHKSWGNAIEFNEGAEKIGVDVMRFMYITQNPTSNLLFGYKRADETRRKFHLVLWNVYNFFVTYANIDKFKTQNEDFESFNFKLTVLDKWILSKLHRLINLVTDSLEKYDAYTSSNAMQGFVSDLSTWYIRRSRGRVGKTAKNKSDKEAFYQTTYVVLATLSKLLAPFTPFIAEEIYSNLKGGGSVHLSSWPQIDRSFIDETLEESMAMARRIVEMGHSERKKAKIKVRQPLSKITIKNLKYDLSKDLKNIILDELNIKKIEVKKGTGTEKIKLDTKLSQKLINEGKAREIVREIQRERKKLGFHMDDAIELTLPSWPEKYTSFIKQHTLALRLKKGSEVKIERV